VIPVGSAARIVRHNKMGWAMSHWVNSAAFGRRRISRLCLNNRNQSDRAKSARRADSVNVSQQSLHGDSGSIATAIERKLAFSLFYLLAARGRMAVAAVRRADFLMALAYKRFKRHAKRGLIGRR
jgi:hypothetical protein